MCQNASSNAKNLIQSTLPQIIHVNLISEISLIVIISFMVTSSFTRVGENLPFYPPHSSF